MDDITQSFPPCEPECQPATWPVRNLILGTCPRCTTLYEDQAKLARMLRARALTGPMTHEGGPTP